LLSSLTSAGILTGLSLAKPMRLLHLSKDSTFKLTKDLASNDQIPPYAILFA
jgi:hypothetical protein